MNSVLIFTIILVAVIVAVFVLARKGSREAVIGICQSALDQTVRKNVNKDKILKLLGERGGLSNSEIREALNVSRQSIVNYTSELEREGKIEQEGTVGRGVIYRLR